MRGMERINPLNSTHPSLFTAEACVERSRNMLEDVVASEGVTD